MHIFIKILLLNLISAAFCGVASELGTTHSDNDTIFYFAYGSNLLASRLHIGVPSAQFYSAAKLKGYRLDFNMQSDSWRGAVATICQDPESNVWGALWKINIKESHNLDKQEGIDKNWYYPKNVRVTTENDTQIKAGTYIERQPCPAKVSELPSERQPSITYLKVIVDGAEECKLPAGYINYLNTIKNNKQLATDTLRKQLGSEF